MTRRPTPAIVRPIDRCALVRDRFRSSRASSRLPDERIVTSIHLGGGGCDDGAVTLDDDGGGGGAELDVGFRRTRQREIGGQRGAGVAADAAGLGPAAA